MRTGMKRSRKAQWVTFGVAITVLGAGLGWIANAMWGNLGELRRELSTLQAESFHIADHLDGAIRELNETALRFDVHRNAADLDRFRRQGADAQEWISQQRPRVNTERERDLLREIQGSLSSYTERVGAMLSAPANGASGASPLLIDMLEREAARYLALCGQFDEAQQWSLGQFGRESHRTAELLQRLLILAAVILLMFWAVVSALLYRTMVAPLRARLVETRSIVERQEKLAALGTLAAGVAHEIRNPLTAIKVRLHSLKHALECGSSEHEDAGIIGNEIQRLERIVKDFLQFARPSEPQFTVTAADAVLQHVRELFRKPLESSGVEIRLLPSPPLTVRVDPQQLEQVLINLVQNAAESIEQRGAVTLRAFSTRAQLQGRATPAVALEVSDTGKGIPAEVQKRLFDPFFTTKPAGTGLGLSIAARIVESHGGALQYQTELNRGTVFRVLLPAVQADES